MVAVEVRQGTLVVDGRGEDEEEDEEEEDKDEEEEGRQLNIKSNHPHLTGGEKTHQTCRNIFHTEAECWEAGNTHEIQPNHV